MDVVSGLGCFPSDLSSFVMGEEGKSCVDHGHGQLSALPTTTAHKDRARTRGGLSGGGGEY